ncbi:hypothetical protein [Nostoc sp. NMS4]|uniref:hypothetical protein n=1 Tax=Nostoc sp. NMS4 TaxID=2815390 RepID=UPI0025CF67B0|nr:hypothetical protein [Nostoc sp. NMS4]MBN3925985.1 hypothetical protein [Nostoc sp. NMS4]
MIQAKEIVEAAHEVYDSTGAQASVSAGISFAKIAFEKRPSVETRFIASLPKHVLQSLIELVV